MSSPKWYSMLQRTMTRTEIANGIPTAAAPPSAIAALGVSNKGVAAAVITAIDSGRATFTPLRFRSIGEVGNRKASKQVSDISIARTTITLRIIGDMLDVEIFEQSEQTVVDECEERGSGQTT